MIHRRSNCPYSQLQPIAEELFLATDFDVETSIVYKQWVHNGHTKIVFITNTVRERNEKFCQTADLATTLHYTVKSQTSYLKMLKETILPNTRTVTLLYLSDNYSFYVKIPYKGSTRKLIRLLSTLL
jgi:hypothetical protein